MEPSSVELDSIYGGEFFVALVVLGNLGRTVQKEFRERCVSPEYDDIMKKEPQCEIEMTNLNNKYRAPHQKKRYVSQKQKEGLKWLARQPETDSSREDN